ncbi:hypothetical protein SAMN06264364_11924 [Quadrisphaera granulorum]|uniref:Acetyltransferase (GNAT) family protein n=1 Tax=Quadrisphaera granulorum TaxID=317664 RepID=A0A316A4Y5_9ACTN|nr:hypothetical protein [Quadrisphaera granulorum]PWJ52532.1 hypothetical protein BXY45_11924 [Quadrisphaera granulorum]SZE97582.1 hypothetical protein SAMN06264364_11924 [Quadrisphaera granulorum]
MGSTDVGRSDVSVLPMTEQDWPAVHDIYASGIATGHATFEASPPSWEDFDSAKAPQHRLVAVDPAGRVLGWAAVVAVSDRCVYAGVGGTPSTSPPTPAGGASAGRSSTR